MHSHIQAEARQTREGPTATLRDADETPALAALLGAAKEAVAVATPTKFEYEGRTYWLRCSIGLARFEVFDSPATARPLITGLGGSTTSFGHTPAH
ncbi:hypothetical protein [Polaromonas sp.]|uniref:hypothetical protein n=1 Tax=Polaromonas sp. TaxID=1869339 RepID=UPI003752D839